MRSSKTIGDAGCCGSPLSGMGTAMAIVGAYVLAAEIAATPDNLAARSIAIKKGTRRSSTK